MKLIKGHINLYCDDTDLYQQFFQVKKRVMLFQMYVYLVQDCVKWFQKMNVCIFSREPLVYYFSSQHFLNTIANQE